MPYVGYGTESVGGDTTYAVPPYVPLTNRAFQSGENYALAGLNGHFSFHHFFVVDTKYMAMFQKAKTLNSVTLQANFYLTRNVGLTYQYKYMEQTSGKDIYGIFGVVIVLG